jgi:hypothetical protein
MGGYSKMASDDITTSTPVNSKACEVTIGDNWNPVSQSLHHLSNELPVSRPYGFLLLLDTTQKTGILRKKQTIPDRIFSTARRTIKIMGPEPCTPNNTL